eukprot:jgi/Botrbrau1/8640/Bobra.0196s0034.1
MVLFLDRCPVAYEGRLLTPAKANYPTKKQELLAAVQPALCGYLEGALTVRLVTDHRAITYLNTLPSLTHRQMCWAELISRFDFQWPMPAGKNHVAVNALSRHPVEYTPPCFLYHARYVSAENLGFHPPPPVLWLLAGLGPYLYRAQF